MKKARSPESAQISFRLLLAFTLCLGGLSLTVPAFGSWQGLSILRFAHAKKQIPYPEKEIRERKRETSKKALMPRSMAAKSNSSRGTNPATPAGPGQPFNGVQPTVTKQNNSLGQTVYSIKPSNFDLSPPVTELARLSLPEPPTVELPELRLPPWRILRSNTPDPVTQVAPGAADAKAPKSPTAPTAATTGFNFEGIPGTGSFPPDTNGSVGNNQYVETVNTRYQVWSLNRTTNTATSALGPVSINTLWAGFGGACQTQNAGDPVVLYDKVANRWLISQFTSDPDGGGVFYQCVAISKTADATGQFYRYAFAVPDGDFGDYPHYGVWSDAYYVMGHSFEPDGSGGFSFVAAIFGAMDRAKMLAGDATATWQVILDPMEGGHMPADLDGFAPPPAGAPGIFTSVHPDGMYLYRMKVDFTTSANTARTLQAVLPIAPASAACGGTDCIPQPQSAFTIDSLGDRLMFRLAYRNFIVPSASFFVLPV